MRRHIGSVLITGILCVAGAVSSFAESAPLSPVTRSAGSVTVSVDPRIELLMVVQSLGSYREKMFTATLTKYDYQYTRDVQTYFAPYKTHRAVTLFDQMWQKGFWLGAPVEAMIDLRKSDRRHRGNAAAERTRERTRSLPGNEARQLHHRGCDAWPLGRLWTAHRAQPGRV